jgi:hypothetical protein
MGSYISRFLANCSQFPKNMIIDPNIYYSVNLSILLTINQLHFVYYF